MIINFFILAGIEYIHYIKKLLLMKKITLFLLAICIQLELFAALTTLPISTPASSVLLPIGISGQKISLKELSEISIKNFESLSRKKMNSLDRLGFKLAQRNLKKSILEDGTLNNKKLEKLALKIQQGNSGFHAGGFFLGFLLGAIGLVIAYVIDDDKKKRRIKSAWVGFGIGLVLYLVVVLLYASTV
jgi:hypothetical protein